MKNNTFDQIISAPSTRASASSPSPRPPLTCSRRFSTSKARRDGLSPDKGSRGSCEPRDLFHIPAHEAADPHVHVRTGIPHDATIPMPPQSRTNATIWRRHPNLLRLAVPTYSSRCSSASSRDSNSFLPTVSSCFSRSLRSRSPT